MILGGDWLEKVILLAPKETVLDAFSCLGLGEVFSSCGGHGSCGRCRMQVEGAELSPATKMERVRLGADELEQGFRFSCMAYNTGNAAVRVKITWSEDMLLAK